jgi:hypothetical protein
MELNRDRYELKLIRRLISDSVFDCMSSCIWRVTADVPDWLGLLVSAKVIELDLLQILAT